VRFDREISPPSVNEGKGWTFEAARDWLTDHNMFADKSYEETDFFRFRQSDDKSDNFATVSTGMPEGVLLTTGDTPKGPSGFKAVDGENIKGKSLSAFLSVALPEDVTSRSMAMRKIAKSADISLSTMHMLVAGKMNCPTRKTLEIFADCLDVPVDRLISAAKRDGCEYE
jgi:hypothetical protein